LARKQKSFPHEARTIDLDILLFNQEIINYEKVFTEENEELHISIPHLRLSERLFVLKPLCDIDTAQEYYSRKSNKNKSFCEELFDNFIKTNDKCAKDDFEDFINFEKEINSITNLDYLNIILVFTAQAPSKMQLNQQENKDNKEKEQKEFFVLDCKEFIIVNRKQQEK